MEKPLEQLDLRPGAPDNTIEQMIDAVGTSLPEDYTAFLRFSNGAVGHGPDLFVILEPAERVPEVTRRYEAPPGLVIIGGDGCGNIIGVDARTHDPASMEYVVVDPVWLDVDTVSCQHRSRTFLSMLDYLTNRSGQEKGTQLVSESLRFTA